MFAQLYILHSWNLRLCISARCRSPTVCLNSGHKRWAEVIENRCLRAKDRDRQGEEKLEEEERKWERQKADLYKKEAEIFMEVSVLIHKPLGVLQLIRPIAAKEKDKHTCVHIRAHTLRASEVCSSSLSRLACHANLFWSSSPNVEGFLWVWTTVIRTVFTAAYGLD